MIRRPAAELAPKTARAGLVLVLGALGCAHGARAPSAPEPAAPLETAAPAPRAAPLETTAPTPRPRPSPAPPGDARTSRPEPPAAAPLPAAPTLAWTDRDLEVQGLPAIAEDGSRVVLAHRDNDGGRGNPNLTLVEKDRDDRELRRLVVVTANDSDGLDAAARAARVATGQAFLRERHQALRLRPLVAMTTPNPVAEHPAPATGGGLALRWADQVLTLDRAGAPALVRPTPPSWLAAERPLCATCTERCQNPAFLRGGFVDAPRRLLLVIIEYRGTDTCWEPSAQEHVLTW